MKAGREFGVLLGVLAISVVAVAGLGAQYVPVGPIVTQPEVLNLAALAEQGKALIEKARAGSGRKARLRRPVTASL